MWDEQVPQLVTLTNWAASSSLPPWEQKWKANRGEDVTIKVSKVRGKRKNLPKRKPGPWGKGIGGADEASEKNLKIVKISISDNVLCADVVTSICSIVFLFNALTKGIRVKRVFLVVSPSARIDCQRDDLWAHRKLSSPRYCVTLHCYLVPLCLASIRSQTKAFCVPGITLFVEASLL